MSSHGSHGCPTHEQSHLSCGVGVLRLVMQMYPEVDTWARAEPGHRSRSRSGLQFGQDRDEPHPTIVGDCCCSAERAGVGVESWADGLYG